MEIRPFEPRDAGAISELIEACFTSLDLGHHTPRGVQLQLEANLPERLIERSHTISYFVAVDRGDIVGVCGHDSQRIHTLFVRPDRHRAGIGGRLLRLVLDHARTNGLKEIRTWSTHHAFEFYLRFGFQRCRAILLPEGQEDIGLVEMVKEL